MVGVQHGLIVSQDGLNAPVRVETHGPTGRPFPDPVRGGSWRLRLMHDEALGGQCSSPLMGVRSVRCKDDATTVALNDLNLGALPDAHAHQPGLE
jgi:hypothetical protein